MKDKILVLGDKGMLGHVVKRYFEETGMYDVIGLNRDDCDFNDLNHLELKINMIKPNFIINCVGILNKSNDVQLYARINIDLPHFMANISRKYNFKLFHISTNCVFDGGRNDENAIPNAKDLYGLSKAFGEVIDDHNVTIRCSITGPEIKSDGTGLMNSFIKNKDFTNGYTNMFWNGVTTLELCDFIDFCIDGDVKGLVNYYTVKEKNKYDVVNVINNYFYVNRPLTACEGVGHQSLLAGPYFCDKSLQKQFMELRDWMRDNKDLYKGIYNNSILGV